MKTKKITLKSGSARIPAQMWDLRDKGGPIDFRPDELRDTREAMELNAGACSLFQCVVGTEFVDVPYVFPLVEGRCVGDFSSHDRTDDFWNWFVSVDGDRRKEPHKVRDIWRFAELVRRRQFRHRSHCMCLRSVADTPNGVRLTVASGMYDNAFFTVGSEDLPLTLNKEQLSKLRLQMEPGEFAELKGLVSRFRHQFGKRVSIRRAVYKLFGGWPDYSLQVCDHIMGCAAVVLTRDDQFIFGLRTPEQTAVNFGINVPISGGFDYSDEEDLCRTGLPYFMVRELLREGREEVGLMGNDCVVNPTAFIADLTRAGTPDTLFLIRYRGTAGEFMKGVVGHTRPNSRDADVFLSIPRSLARTLITDVGASKLVHHKLLVTLIMAFRHLENCS